MSTHYLLWLLLITCNIAQDGPCPDCKMPPYYTCFEQNKYTFAGYRDPDYVDNPEYPQYNQGDVCDHQDPNTGEFRNICRFQVHRDDCSNPDAQYQNYKGDDCTSTWKWGCSHDSECPDGWEQSSDGCVEVNNGAMIVCCCRGDFCNDEQYLQYSIQGFTDPDMACDVQNGKCADNNSRRGGKGTGSKGSKGSKGANGAEAQSELSSDQLHTDSESILNKLPYQIMIGVLSFITFAFILFCIVYRIWYKKRKQQGRFHRVEEMEMEQISENEDGIGDGTDCALPMTMDQETDENAEGSQQ
mmetsp:Transcript_14936/g.13412  ORF Transcript_14936/g.13412 Transcript_14936/m.13412 type:complete len:300 (+) Transcript_14936:28-927(+)